MMKKMAIDYGYGNYVSDCENPDVPAFNSTNIEEKLLHKHPDR